ncbi:MAG TPA: hypothetical protein IGR89_12505 [Oscillatoriaceae cyanobacterium M7585_C2015_266]|nr:hypothetical protein [Oscillatoriaceae cyanobacterium M7585_C2015_266]
MLQPFNVERNLSKRVLFDLVSAYCSKERYYHTLGHIQQVLEIVEGMRTLVCNFPAIQLAAWFHDVIYDPKATDNEERSAEYAATALKNLLLPQATIDAVTAMILSTKYHQVSKEDIDTQILLDADLAILGADEPEYKFYSKAIRREYGWMPEEEYRQKRVQVLLNFLKRERIFFTKNKVFDELETRARRNIQAEIKTLSSNA